MHALNGREMNDAGNHFAARGVELVHLVASVCLVGVVQRTHEVTQPRASLSAFSGRVFIDAGVGNGEVTRAFAAAFDRTIAIEPNTYLLT
jgi:hypothetical protein